MSHGEGGRLPCPGCTERDEQIEALERDLRTKRAENTRLRNQLTPPRNPKIDAEVQEVFYYWVAECRKGSAQVKLTAQRARRIRDRLNEGYESSFILRAIDGARDRPTTVEGRVYDDIELVCRDGQHLEDHERRSKRGGTPDLMAKLVGT